MTSEPFGVCDWQFHMPIGPHAKYLGCVNWRPVEASAPAIGYPRPCGLCPGQIESVEDLDWHGLGNCVPICEHCMGSGIGKEASAPAAPPANEPYFVEVDQNGCGKCGAGRMYTVIGPDGMALGESWGGEDGENHASDIADWINMAFEAGKESRAAPDAELRARISEREMAAFHAYRADCTCFHCRRLADLAAREKELEG